MIDIDQLCLQVNEFSLQNISFKIPKGEYFALMGPTGAGKSMLIKAICGLVTIDSGTIKIDNQDVTGLEPRFRSIGYVPQNSGLFPHLNVEQNLIFSLIANGKASKAKAIEEVAHIVKALGLNNFLKRSIEGLSGGERQKVALGRALAAEPKLLILDEPVSALDEITRKNVCEEIINIHDKFGITTIHICHNVDEAITVASKIGVMNQGQFIAAGTYEELSADKDNEMLKKFFTRENKIGTARKTNTE